MASKKPIAARKSSFDLIDREKFLASLSMSRDSVVLDAACGVGSYSLAMASRCPNGKIFSFDLWEAGIDRLCDEILADAITNIVPRVADLCTLPLGNDTIDICLLATVLHDLMQDGTDQGALREIKRVLRPGGVLAVIEFKKIAGKPGPPINIRINPAELDETLRLLGFTPCRKAEIDLGDYNYLALYCLP